MLTSLIVKLPPSKDTNRKGIYFLNIRLDEYHLTRVSERLGDDGVKQAFKFLLDRLHLQSRFELLGSPHGAYSAINLCLDGSRCYAFRGTKSWIAWYFRRPAFRTNLVNRDQVLRHFIAHDPFENNNANEIWIKIRSQEDAILVLDFIL